MIRGDEGTEVRGYENTYNVALLRVKSILVPPYPRTPVPPYPRTSVPPYPRTPVPPYPRTPVPPYPRIIIININR